MRTKGNLFFGHAIFSVRMADPEHVARVMHLALHFFYVVKKFVERDGAL
jgi:hypothetical protein